MAIIILVIGIVSRKAREGKKKAQPEASPEPTDDVAENLNSPGSPAAEQIQPPKNGFRQPPETLNNYRESRHPKETPSSPPAYHPPGARNRINGMSELKKAVCLGRNPRKTQEPQIRILDFPFGSVW